MKNNSLELVGRQLQTKRKGKQKDKEKHLWNTLHPLPSQKKIRKYLTNHTKNTVALGITQNLKKFVFPADKKGVLNISTQIEEIETPDNSDKGWKILDKTKEVSVHGILKENSLNHLYLCKI